MPTLEELLRASLNDAGGKVNEADQALHDAVVEVAKAAEAATGGKATVRLQPKKRTQGRTANMGEPIPGPATYYSLVVLARGEEEGPELTTFCVSESGRFPIHHEVDYQWEAIWSADDLTKYFGKSASDRDSVLVGHLAYIVRHALSTD